MRKVFDATYGAAKGHSQWKDADEVYRWVRSLREDSTETTASGATGRPVSFLFDTTVLIDWSVAHPGVKAVVERCYDETGELYTCDVVVCEALSAGSEVEREVIRQFVGGLEYLCIDPDGARHAGELRRIAERSSGRTLGDALIAALAIRMGATIVTRNASDFAAFDLSVLTY